MTTLLDVARLADVTTATVSNVLRDRGRFSARTRARVLEAVAQLQYRPHLTARALAEGRPPTIALMVSSIANPFYPEFALAAERAARRDGYFLIICNTNDDADVGQAYFDQIGGTLSEGILIMNSALDVDALYRGHGDGSPVVLCMWERPDRAPTLPCVAVDFFLAGRLAAAHLLELGHRRIGAIVGSARHGIHAARYEGFCQTLREADIAGFADDVRFTDDSIQGGHGAAQSLLRANPALTAIFATNDLPALGAVYAALDMGRAVPDALSVIGITDIRLARESRPALTTIAVPTAAAADLAVALLRELIRDADMTDSTLRVAPAPRLVQRDTTGIRRA
ncbi:LacI family DNA-binding transcriptional regulator [Robbsia sp. Bb-Pol-6]|uniref:LacI family DNA-binding transcriptional regulator n=1 Tax=Robbsia betulipollinis TaxID=2981849 RepID=A0ABT3ZJ64_9BURK|nr:LacI family DNA-binding transcriptional regulator [Robbsia betulipollinis]MCY0386576.1 LacI family DNA-binding transcriptional regulator [Robbsia betulipollinis]